jgi:hypothetical protein
MGVDLVGELRRFDVSTEDFVSVTEGGDGSVDYGCVSKGRHRVLRFDMVTYNKGDKDLILRDPANPELQRKYFRPAKPELTEGTGFQFKAQPFFTYSLRDDDSSIKLSGYKEAFCFDGIEMGNCDKQGLLAKKLPDVYDSDMACQFIVIDGLAPGEYILEATVNAPSVEAIKNGNGEVFIEEDNYDNNTIAVRLQINQDSAIEIRNNNQRPS